jgi:PBSX family phage terminase large subunit
MPSKPSLSLPRSPTTQGVGSLRAKNIQRPGVLNSSKPFQPFGAVKDLFYDQDIELTIQGPAGTGKTRGVMEKINLQMLKYPGSRALFCRKTRTSMSETVLVTWEDKVLPDNKYIYPETRNTLRKLRQVYNYPNGSTVVVAGLDDPEKIKSSEYDVIGLFEGTEANEADWELLLSRLRNNVMPYQQAIADCNPVQPSNWLNTRPKKGKMRRLLSWHKDNPVLYDVKMGQWTRDGDRYINEILGRLTGSRKSRLLEGLWVATEGMVYTEWDPDKHLVDPFPIPKNWRRVRCIDFGYTNPFACVWLAISPDGVVYVYRLWYRTRTLIEDHAKKIVELTGDELIEETVIDPESPEGIRRLSNNGVIGITAYNDIQTGIEAVAQRLRRNTLKIFRDCLVEVDPELEARKKVTTIDEEFDSYHYPAEEKQDERDKNYTEKPVDKDNHALDALRYGVAYVDQLAVTMTELTADTPVAA